MKPCVFILCYNSRKNIPNCFKEIKKIYKKTKKIYFVDNCSTDNTIELIKTYKNKFKINNLFIIKNKKNLGMGGSWKNCLSFIYQKKIKLAFFAHSSGKGKIDNIVINFLKVLKKNPKQEIIFASRFHKKSKLQNYSKTKIIGNKFFNFMTWVTTGYKFGDSGCGIISINNINIKKLNYTSFVNDAQFNPQLNISFMKNNFQIKEIPISWSSGKVGSHVNVLKYSIKLLKLLTYYFFFRKF
ncbi:glycosyltransferase [Pelagibacterales bacterium SAG-MED03]|nr:glycosyltransferase [Pelagibacterales bacterium SAG-MED03]